MSARNILPVFCLLAALFMPAFANAATVAYWRMESDTDAGAGLSTPNEVAGAPAAISAAASLSSDVFGSPVPQTGDSNSMSVAPSGLSAATFPVLEALTSATVEFWMKDSSPSGSELPLKFANGFGTGFSRGFLFRDTGNLFVSYARDGISGSKITSGVNVSDGDWHHVAFTYDEISGVAGLYIDGDLKISDDGPDNKALKLELSSSSLNFASSLLDEVRISDVALAPSQFLNAVPEPTSLVLVGLGLLGVCSGRRRS